MKKSSLVSGYLYGFLSMIVFPLLLVQLNMLLNLPSFNNILNQFVGALLVITGGVLLFYSTQLFKRHGKGGSPLPFDPPKELVTTGIYKYSRNPMFVASGMIWFGEFLYFGSILLFFYALVWVLINHIHLVTTDEKLLAKRYGARYNQYKKRTPRYLVI